MAEQEKMGVNEFKNFLLENFATNENIEAISEQFSSAKRALEKSLEVDEIPSFYSDAKKYMSVNTISIDSSGKIDENIIKQLTNQVKKEVQEKQQNTNNEEKQQIEVEENNNHQELDERKIYEERLSKIKAVDDSIEKYGGIEGFLENATRQELDQFISLRREQHVFDSIDELLVNVVTDPNRTLTPEEQERLEKSSQGKFFKCDSSTHRISNEEDVTNYIVQLNYYKARIRNYIEQKKDSASFIEILSEFKNDEAFYTIGQIKTDQDLKEIFDDTFKEVEATYQKVIPNAQTPQAQTTEDLTQKQSNYGAQASIQEKFEQHMRIQMDKAVDYAEISQYKQNNRFQPKDNFGMQITVADIKGSFSFLDFKTPELAETIIAESIAEEEIFKPTQKEQVRLEDETDEEVIDDGEMESELESEPELEPELEPESKEGMQEPEYETPTFEEEKTGLAGLVAAIANSKAVKAFRNLFKPKQEQKKLNAAVTQRIENGLKITDYESNGSLVPTTIQARHALINFSVNTVKAITDFANNISNAIRRNDKEDPVINRPTIVSLKDESEVKATSETKEQQVALENGEPTKTLEEQQQGKLGNSFDQYKLMGKNLDDFNAGVDKVLAKGNETLKEKYEPNKNTNGER